MNLLPSRLLLPQKTILGRGRTMDLWTECAAFGPRGVLVYGTAAEQQGLIPSLKAARPKDDAVLYWRHHGGEPNLHHVDDLLAASRAHHADWVAGIGGGSVLDLAKACAGLYHAGHPSVRYHDGAPIDFAPLPLAAVPTTAGSGTEATPNAVLIDSDRGTKKSIRHDSWVPRLVILDADRLRGCVPAILAQSGMDAFTQAVEAYCSQQATWISDQFALMGLGLVAENLEPVFTDGQEEASELLLQGSYLAGAAFANARLGLVHGLAHPLGSIYGVPHGLVCATCLPAVLEFNRDAIGSRYDVLSSIVGDDVLTRTRDLLSALGLVSPFKGREVKDRARIIMETLASGSTAANPRPVTMTDVETIIDQLFA